MACGRILRGSTLAALLALACGCSSYRTAGPDAPQQLEDEAQAAAIRFQQTDPSLDRFFKSAHGMAVFPKITKGGAGIGFASGEGVVIEKGEVVGYVSMSQGTLGAQLGGQTYSQIIFFQDQPTLSVFKGGNFEFSANASAVAVEAGAGAASDFQSGVAVFTLSRGGLMFEATIGGQQFHYVEKGKP